MDKSATVPRGAAFSLSSTSDTRTTLLFFIIIRFHAANFLYHFLIFQSHTSTFTCQLHSCHMSPLPWLVYKGEHHHWGRNDFEAENKTALTFPVLNYADVTLASHPLCEYFPWQPERNMLIMLDVDQGPTGADDIQISNNIQRSPHSHCCELIPDSRDMSHTNPSKDNCIRPSACVL